MHPRAGLGEDRAGPAVAAARAAGRGDLLEHEVYGVLSRAGFNVPRHFVWPGPPGDAGGEELAAFLEGLPGTRSS